jgi:BlaI family transcriptional regulator, penicillinase repressor
MNITAAESHVMDTLWDRGALTVDELVAAVAGPQGWGEATVKTLINRLLKKKAIQSTRTDGRHRYEAIVQRAAYVQSESQGLLDRLFEGRLTPLVAHFAEHRKLKPDEIKRLRKLLDDLDDEGGGQ